MFQDIENELTIKLVELKIWLRNLKDDRESQIDRGFYFVYIYGIFEWFVTSVVKRTIEKINESNSTIDELIYDIYPLIFSREFDSIYKAGNATKWEKRARISERLNKNDIVHIDDLLPTDGRNIQKKQLESIALVFGLKDSAFPNDECQGYLVEAVENRNHIAHGDESPAEVGKRFTVKDLIKNETKIEELSLYILEEYEQYINNKDFLRKKIPEMNKNRQAIK